MQKFKIHFPKKLTWFNNLCILLSLIAIMFWQAPLSYRLSLMTGVIALSCIEKKRFIQYTKLYPWTLTYQNHEWHLNEEVVKIDNSSLLTRYYISLCLKNQKQEKQYLMITQKSFAKQEEYYELIRYVKTHRGSF